MMILFNSERVILEVVELARLKISGILKVPSSAVMVTLERSSTGGISPIFSVDSEEAEGISEAEIKEVMAAIYAESKADLAVRLEGLAEFPYGKETQEEASA